MTPSPVSMITGRTVFYWLVGFFGVIISVNFIMAVLALATFNGVTNDSAYVDGLAYNDQLHDVARQKALGWDVQAEIKVQAGRTVKIDARYLDQSDALIGQLNVRAYFQRPTHEGFDFDVPLVQTGAGRYTAEVEVPLAGLWDMRTVAVGRGQEPYVLTYRVFVP